MLSGSPKLCQECVRISNAEKRAKQRKMLENRTAQEVFHDQIKTLIKGYGKVSPTLLMMKFKISHEQAVRELQSLM